MTRPDFCDVPATPRRVLLTGATGFVGRHIHRALLAGGHAVRAVVRTGSADRLAGAAVDIVETPDLFAEPPERWRAACRDIDTVVHAAWYVLPGRYLAAPENLDCVRGSLALAQGAAEAGVTHLLGIGTCFEYRLPSDRLTVDAPLGPTTLYGMAKKSLFEVLTARFAEGPTRFSWARLFYLHGAGEPEGRLLPYLRARLSAGQAADLSSGTQRRDFLDVSEAGRMIAAIVATRQPGAINVCSGEAVTIRQFAESVADGFGRRDLLRFGAVPPRPGDPAAVVGICNVEALPGNRTERP